MSNKSQTGTNTFPSSLAKHQANIANAQLSTGPRTEAGKSKSSMNARRHGLTGQFYVMNEADRLAYTTFEKGILQSLSPEGPYETQYAISIAQDHWRLNRSRAIEYNTYGLGHHEHAGETGTDSPETEAAITQAQTWRDGHPGFTNITLYEARVRRLIALNEKRLQELQQARTTAEAQAREEAELLLEEKLAELEPIDQTQPIHLNGFVFSCPTLLAAMAHKQAVAQARWYKARNWDRSRQPSFVILTFPKAA